MQINRPTELADHLAYLSVYPGELPTEDELSDSEAFGLAFEALKLFLANTQSG